MSIELILGIIGTVTGILALVIHIIKLSREKPHLQVELIDCHHLFNPEKEPSTRWIMYFFPHFRIANLGDRSTTVSNIEVLFKINDKEYSTPKGANYLSPTRIDAHDTVDIQPQIYSYDETIKEQKLIDAVFTIHHTHGKEKIKCTSEMVI